MGQHEEWAEPGRLLPNGLLANAAPMIRVLDSERWLKAEERTAELISCIQPTRPSEQRRNAVADYVQRLIMKCFPCQVFTFGSMPLKTYLPDGDIDLTAFSNNQNLKDTWAYQVRDMLEKEEKNDNAEFHVKEVQYIQAEVKIIKCLVENIVVDISFNQLGGLCTLCFLEEVDHLINHNHLFKRSIILIKAWCYYESRILGAHHGLISTYALETLVLYIFHVFNNTFTGPLEVLFRFLEFFSKFDWDNFCVSLWGPVPMRSLPDVIVEPPRKDNGELLLKKLFLDACNSVYAVNPGVQENQGPPFVSKHFNVIDPLRVNNNLGRSVSKGNFFRIRSAFSFGAKRLERLLDCPKEKLTYEVNQFFMNTWDRHGTGCRPDAPRVDLSCLKLSDLHHQPENEILSVSTNSRMVNASGHDVKTEGTHSHVSSHPGNHISGSMSKPNDYSNYTQNKKTHRNSNASRVSDHSTREAASRQNVLSDVSHRTSTSDNLVKDIQSRFLFARTRSSPELTDTYVDNSSPLRRTRVQESAKMNPTPTRQENSNRRKNPGSENTINHNIRSLHDDTSSVRQNRSHQNNDTVTDSNNGLNTYFRDFGLDTMNEEFSSTSRTQDMLQEEQDLVNLMASLHGFNGQVHLPFNLVSAQLPFPISPSFLTSMGYSERSIPGLVPTNIPMVDPAFSDMQFQHSIISPHLTHYFPGIGLSPTSQDGIDHNNENFSSMDINSGEAENGFWREQDAGSTCGFGPNNGNFEVLQAEDKLRSTHSGLTVDPSWVSSASNSLRAQQNHTKEKRGLMREERSTNYQFQDNRTNDVYVEERLASSRLSSTAHSSPLRSKSSSESSWDGSSTKSSKSARERRGKKTVIGESTNGYGKGKVMSESLPCQNEDDYQEWNSMSTELAERGQGSQSVVSLHVPRHHVPEYEVAHTSGSESIIPIAPMFIGTGSRQRMTDNSGVIAFYPTGPPVPFVTMLPLCNIPPETGTPDTSECHFGGEESIDNSDSSHNFASFEGLDYTEDLNPSHSLRGAASVLESEPKSDILHSDFASHWQNLQYGRFCQNTRYGPLVYPSPVMVPPTYMQGHFPWDGPGRPISANMNLFTQLMSYSPRLVPVAPIQSVTNRPANMFQRYVDDMPRYRSGTGTYLPNHPKVTARDRHSSGSRRGNYNYERNDNHGDRDGNWKGSSKTRASGRSHNRSQTEKSNSRLDWLSPNESRADRTWSSHRNDTFASYQSQRANSDISGVPDVAYGMYPFTAMNPTGVSSNGPTVPPLVMLYPFDNPSYCSHGEQLEFGSLGPVGVSGLSEQPQLGEGSRPRGTFDDCRFHVQRSSPDQPSSPLHQRRI
ncbi:uncharacterized protein LOC115996529 [Ipomoea triloba]|uniref:uncharacterized protein LOC115996529 n=1 Tax=Ipomoea triloba TaxID=35885 RepID=UPI00125E65D8|nr:uncharacterized protein LOC115996529 [Ipomoea triloba]